MRTPWVGSLYNFASAYMAKQPICPSLYRWHKTLAMTLYNMRITLDSRDVVWLSTRGLGDVGVVWYTQEDGYLRRAFPNPAVAVVPSRGGWTIQIKGKAATAAVWVPGPPPGSKMQPPPGSASIPEDGDAAMWAETCRLHPRSRQDRSC